MASGAVLVAALAVVVDVALLLAERGVVSRGLSGRYRRGTAARAPGSSQESASNAVAV
jgi:osmoprotectant transport system permease protein